MTTFNIVDLLDGKVKQRKGKEIIIDGVRYFERRNGDQYLLYHLESGLCASYSYIGKGYAIEKLKRKLGIQPKALKETEVTLTRLGLKYPIN